MEPDGGRHTAASALSAIPSCRPQEECSGCSLPATSDAAPPAAAPTAGRSGKEFLGGYRSLRTGALHHHACTQTLDLQPPAAPDLVCSEAQTVWPKSSSVQTRADAYTQCPRTGWYEDTSNDRIVLPSAHHETAAQILERKALAAVTIQRFARGWLARKRAAAAYEAKQALDEFAAHQEAQRRRQEEEHEQAEMRRRMQPRSAADFAILHNELGAWWEQEAASIRNADADKAAKQGALRLLLAKETKLLQTIDKLKIAAAVPNRASRVDAVLQRLAAPKHWPLSNGKLVEVQTPSTLRAAELGAVYRALVAADGSVRDARLSALMQAKHVLRGADPDCAPAQAVLQLADREIDLLSRGRDPARMDGLRLRITNSFFEAIQDPRCNPESASLTAASRAASHKYKFTRHNAECQQKSRACAGVQAA